MRSRKCLCLGHAGHRFSARCSLLSSKHLTGGNDFKVPTGCCQIRLSPSSVHRLMYESPGFLSLQVWYYVPLPASCGPESGGPLSHLAGVNAFFGFTRDGQGTVQSNHLAIADEQRGVEPPTCLTVRGLIRDVDLQPGLCRSSPS